MQNYRNRVCNSSDIDGLRTAAINGGKMRSIDIRSERIKEKSLDTYLPKCRIKSSRSATHTRGSNRAEGRRRQRLRARSCRMHARTYARAAHAPSRPAVVTAAHTYTRRRFVITAGSHKRICIFPRWHTLRQRRHLHPTRHKRGAIALRIRAAGFDPRESVNTRARSKR